MSDLPVLLAGAAAELLAVVEEDIFKNLQLSVVNYGMGIWGWIVTVD